MTMQEVAAAAETLLPDERADLACRLLDGLPDPADGAGAAFIAELRRRMEDMETGRDPGVPADEVFAELARVSA